MKRNDVVESFEHNGLQITQPGKFEGEPIWAPYFWFAYLNGMADEDDGNVITFFVSNEDLDQFPELVDIEKVQLVESESGFVTCYSVPLVEATVQ